MPEKTQRQASEEISHILRRPAVQSFAISDQEQHLLDGSRSADMFVTKRRTGTEGVLHYATPPVEAAHESSEASDSDSDMAHAGMVRDNSVDFLNLQDLREVMGSPSQSSCIRSASIQVWKFTFCEYLKLWLFRSSMLSSRDPNTDQKCSSCVLRRFCSLYY